jgi:hypothetical protein
MIKKNHNTQDKGLSATFAILQLNFYPEGAEGA